jgi:hypothetical protein
VGKETAAVLLITVVHLVGVAVLLWLVLGNERVDWRDWWPRDDRPEPPAPVAPPPSGGGLPLAEADPAGVRLRTEHERLADARRRSRRPEHAPDRSPERV